MNWETEKSLSNLINALSRGDVLPSVPDADLWRVLFRPGERIAFKASIESRAVDARFIRFDGNTVQVPVAGCVNARFYLNPIMGRAVSALQSYGPQGATHGDDGDDVLPSVRLNHESTASFGNLRFEYDEDEDGNKFSGVQGQISQLKLFQSVGLPFSALLFTGGKSIHWILSVDGIETAQEHRLYQLAILARLPGRVDPGSLSGNYPSWIPGSRREKDGVVSEPRVYATGKRIDRAELDRWVAEHPIKNPAMIDLLKLPFTPSDADHMDDELEGAIHVYIEENNIEVAHENHEKLQIHCPNHQDRSPSAYIYKNSGYVGCSSCGGQIDWVRVPGRKVEDEDTKDCPEREQVDLTGAMTFEQFTGQLPLAGEDRVKGLTRLVGFEVDSLKDAWRVKKLLEAFGVRLAAFAPSGEEFTVLAVLDRPVHRRALLAFFDDLKQDQYLPADVRIGLGTDQDGVMEGMRRIAVEIGGELVALTPERLPVLVNKGLGRSAFWIENWYGFAEEEKRKRGSLKRPNKWTRHKARRYQLRSNGKLGPALETLHAGLTDEDRERERWKQQELGKLVRTSRGKVPGTKEWVESGVSLEYLAETDRANLGSLPNFRVLAKIAEGSKRPMIAKRCDELPEGHNKTLIYLVGTPPHTSDSWVISAPAGYGKTSYLQEYLPHHHVEDGFKSAAICRERIRDAIEGEEQSNNPKDAASLITSEDQFATLAAQLKNPGDVIRVQTRQSHLRKVNDKAPTYNEPITIGVTNLALCDERESEDADQDYLHDLLEQPVILSDPETRKPVLARVGYHPNHCLKPNPPAAEKAPRSFCKDCPFTHCRSNPKNAAKIVPSPFVITTHAGFLARSGNVHRFQEADGNKDKRDLVIFDEKPQVFRDCQIEASAESIPLFDTDLIPLAQKSSDFALVRHLRELRDKVAKIRDNALQSSEGKRLKAKAERSNSFSSSMLTISDLPIPESVSIAEVVSSLESIARKEKVSRDHFYSLLDSINSLRVFGGKVIAEFDVVSEKLTLTFGDPQWHKITRAGKRSIVLDATAHLDPDYSLPGAPDLVKLEADQRFPNLTFRPIADFDVSKSKAARNKEHADGLIKVVADLAGKGEKVLVVTDVSQEAKLREQFREQADLVFIDHFGNLKGDNRYRECQHVVFAFTLRWPTSSYLTRALWLFPEKEPIGRQWRASMNGPRSVLMPRGKYATSFRDERLERLRIQIESIEIIQAIMRTKLRDNVTAKVDVWLPSSNAQLFGALLDYFVGATIFQGDQVK